MQLARVNNGPGYATDGKWPQGWRTLPALQLFCLALQEAGADVGSASKHFAPQNLVYLHAAQMQDDHEDNYLYIDADVQLALLGDPASEFAAAKTLAGALFAIADRSGH